MRAAKRLFKCGFFFKQVGKLHDGGIFGGIFFCGIGKRA